MIINVYENNAGHLFIGTDTGPWLNVTGAPDNSFQDDAIALTVGDDTNDWNVEQLDNEPDAPIVATWEERTLTVVETRARQPAAGIAARRYIGLNLLPE